MPKPKNSKCRAGSARNVSVEALLRRELRRLQQKFGLGLELKDVKWIPREGELSGEVKGSAVYVYDRDPEKAVRTLRHEVLGYHLTEKIIRKPIELLNLILKSIKGDIFKRRRNWLKGWLNSCIDPLFTM